MKMPKKNNDSGFTEFLVMGFVVIFGISYLFNMISGDKRNSYKTNDYYSNKPIKSTKDGDIYKPNDANFRKRYRGKQRLKQRLVDPDSLEIINEYIFEIDGEEYYKARYRARNGFGGYVVRSYTTRVD